MMDTMEISRVSGPIPASTEGPHLGLRARRLFSVQGQDPFDCVRWSKRDALISDEHGGVVFTLKDVEAPARWSDMAVNVVASRYFRGGPTDKERETGVREVVLRVVNTLRGWARELGIFASEDDIEVFGDELVVMLLEQRASFNSPVWFNMGVDEKPQCSACFILKVEDAMESILDWYRQEGLIFKGGSGAGVNLSKLRSGREPLAGGGTASGPVSFMKAADASAGVIKSGGKTRRAAKMVVLDADHPDIRMFIRSKVEEERKARALIRAGYGAEFGGEAYSSVAFQNANHAVRVTDDFMTAEAEGDAWRTRFVLSGEIADEFPARDLLEEAAIAAHACGDPGLQFATTINQAHTCPRSGLIRSSNPCSEYLGVDNSACNLGSLRLTAFGTDDGFDVEGFRHAVDIMITAQEIIVDKAAYPNSEIGSNSRALRPLGLGYADLGALLMGFGLPYDSDEARAWAALITAVMTGQAYLHSAILASVLGPFPEFEKNGEDMLRVVAMHRDAAAGIAYDDLPSGSASVVRDLWDEVYEKGRKHGFRNSQVTVLAPTGTVGFMMDCDTTGVEPEMALVKYKSLSGGGSVRMV
ncbi:MAG: adenosylcobalamin-dependent ribonucleoside-diphosphate reductase, partial [Pseudomonadota bacterium]